MPLTEVADLDQTRVRQSNTEAALVALLADPTRVINIGNNLSIVDDVSCNDLAVSATASNASNLRPTRQRAAPFAARLSAMALPIPLLPPVITAI